MKDYFLIWISLISMTICLFVNNFSAYFDFDYIAWKISKKKNMFIYFQVMLSKKLTSSKFVHRYKLFEAKIGKNLVEMKLLLFPANATAKN